MSFEKFDFNKYVKGLKEIYSKIADKTNWEKKFDELISEWSHKEVNEIKCNQDMEIFFSGYHETLHFCLTNDRGCKEFSQKKNKEDFNTIIPLIPECTQIVLGTLEDLSAYISYENIIYNSGDKDTKDSPNNKPIKFSILASKGWTAELNEDFVNCAFYRHILNRSCKYPVRILVPYEENYNKLIIESIDSAHKRATFHELLLIEQIIQVANEQQPGRFEIIKYTGDYLKKNVYEEGSNAYQILFLHDTQSKQVDSLWGGKDDERKQNKTKKIKKKYSRKIKNRIRKQRKTKKKTKKINKRK